MEPYKKKLKDGETNQALDYVYNNALGNVLILKAAPTEPSHMKVGIGYFSDTFYFKLGNGKLFSIAGTEIT